MTTPPSKSTARVPKHPAARVLDGEAEKIKTEKVCCMFFLNNI